MDHHGASGPSISARWWGPTTNVTNADVMNQLCRVCGEPAAGFHFGAFTCEGCKSFFGRTYNNLSSVSECKNNGECIINKKNRTSCKACRLRKCLLVGMSKSGSRYGRRSNWFKIHCLLQEQQQLQQQQQIHHTHLSLGSHATKQSSWEYGTDSTSLLDIDNHNNVVPDIKSDSPPFTIAHKLMKSVENSTFWSGRPNLSTVPHQHTLPYFISPFLQNPLQPVSQNFMLPFLPIRPTSFPLESLVVSSSPVSFSSTTPKKEVLEETDKSLQKLRSLGPIQEQPIDLSFSKDTTDAETLFHRDKNCNITNISECFLVECGEKQEIIEDKPSSKNTVPLDLSCSKL